MDLTPNIPQVVAEVRELFERYEQALVDKNVEVLDATFWNSPHTVRLTPVEHGYGFDEIHAHRVRRPPGPGTKESRFAHLLSGEAVAEETREAAPRADTAVLESRAENERVARLEERVASLQQELAELKQSLLDFKKQFETSDGKLLGEDTPAAAGK